MDSSCLHEGFERQVDLTPDAPAVTFEGEHLTYGELNRRANRLARHLQTCGVEVETRVGLCLNRSIDTIVAILAVLKAGGAYVPMDPIYPAERVRMISEDAACPIILVHQEYKERFVATDEVRVVVMDGGECPWEHQPTENLPPVAEPSNLAYVIFTSGSTGRPKGVLITHHNVWRLFSSTEQWFSFGADDVWSLFHSYSFDLSVWEIWGAFLHGGRVVLVSYLVSRSPEEFYQLLAEEKVTQLCQTPSAFRQLQMYEDSLDERELMALTLRCVVLAGEALNVPSLASWFGRHGDENPCIINMYGITETTIHVTYRRVHQHEAQPGTPSYIGVPIPDQPCYVMRSFGELAAIGEEGELYVGGEGTARGYLNRPELTSERFVESPFAHDRGATLYKSGDLVRLVDGDMIYIGRMDKQVQMRGFRIELGEIEARLSGMEGLESAAVVHHIEGDGPGRLMAYYVATETVPVALLREHLAQSLPEYMIPSGFMRIEVMPLTGNGKLDYGALPEPVFGSSGNGTYIPPHDEIQRELVAIWEGVLGAEQIGIDDNFYELGGNSLDAVRIALCIRETLGYSIPLHSAMTSPTVRILADGLTNLSDETERTPKLPPITASEDPEPALLSLTQSQLWIIDQKSPGMTAYNCAFAITLSGKVEPKALCQCVNGIIARHEVLRTTIDGGTPFPTQRVEPHEPIEIPLVLLDDGDIQERQATARRRIEVDATESFSLEHGPLCRFVLYKLSEESFVLGAHFHHIVIDGWSMKVFVDELVSFYGSHHSLELCAMRELPFQYSDFARWQRECYESGKWSQDMAYWKTQLAGDLVPTELPTDYPRPPAQTYEGDAAALMLATDVTAALREHGAKRGATLTTTAMTIWMILFHRLSRRDEVVVGAATASRDHSGLESLLGFFTNTVVLRCEFSDDPTFETALARVNAVAIEAYEHQSIPFERLVAELVPTRDPSRTPLIQVLISSQVHVSEQVTENGLTIAVEELHNDTAKFDLTISILDRGEDVEFVVEYNTRLFSATSANSLVEAFQAVAQAVAEDSTILVSDLSLVLEEERERLLVGWNRTARAYELDVPVHELFIRQALRSPTDIAVIDGEVAVTYGELAARADAIANVIVTSQEHNGYIGIHLNRSVEMIAAILGVLKAGCVCVPLATDYPSARISYMISDAEVRLIISEERLLPGLSQGAAKVILVDKIEVERSELHREDVLEVSGSEALVYVLYTSGSTGKPKGVAMPHRALTNLVQWQLEEGYSGPKARTLQFAPLSFDVAFQEIFVTLTSGGVLVLVEERVRRDPVVLLRVLWEKRIERLFLPTVMLQHLAAAAVGSEDALENLNEVICAGEQLVISPVIRTFFERLATCRLVNQYGPTESHVVSAYTMGGSPSEWPVRPPVGRPVANVSLFILDRNMQVVPIGFPGELCIGGVALATGYIGRPELTAEKFVCAPFEASPSAVVYKSGDLARYLPSGEIEILGRQDSQAKIRGFRVELGEVEVLLGEHPEVRECVVSVHQEESENGGLHQEGELVAYVVPENGDGGGTWDLPPLREFLSEKLPMYMVPTRFVTLPELPMTASGKVDRARLPIPLRADRGVSEKDVDVPPENELERALVDICARILKRDDIGVYDDFFELGGHSLLAIQFASEIKRSLGVDLVLEAFFARPTIRALARRMNASTSGVDGEERRAARLICLKKGTRNPFFFAFGPGVLRRPYEDLAASMDEAQPFYGFDDLRMVEGVPAHRAIEALARQCVEEIRRVQPTGPYLVGGYSFGGLLAVEMARQLGAAGESVPAVLLLDTFPKLGCREPIGYRLESVLELMLHGRMLFARFVRTWRLQVGYLRDGLLFVVRRWTWGADEQDSMVSGRDLMRWWWRDTAMQHDLIQSGLSVPSIRERRLGMVHADLIRRNTDIIKDVIEAGKEYEIGEVPSRLILLNAEQDPWHRARRDETLGWGEYAEYGVETTVVPGNHITMVRHPYVKALGLALQGYLDRISAPSTEASAVCSKKGV